MEIANDEDIELEQMKDVEFEFSNYSSLTEENDMKSDSQMPVIDVDEGEWDDGVAMRCFDLAIANHDGVGDSNCYTFSPVQNVVKKDSEMMVKPAIRVAEYQIENVQNVNEAVDNKPDSWTPKILQRPQWST